MCVCVRVCVCACVCLCVCAFATETIQPAQLALARRVNAFDPILMASCCGAKMIWFNESKVFNVKLYLQQLLTFHFLFIDYFITLIVTEQPNKLHVICIACDVYGFLLNSLVSEKCKIWYSHLVEM